MDPWKNVQTIKKTINYNYLGPPVLREGFLTIFGPPPFLISWWDVMRLGSTLSTLPNLMWYFFQNSHYKCWIYFKKHNVLHYFSFAMSRNIFYFNLTKIVLLLLHITLIHVGKKLRFFRWDFSPLPREIRWDLTQLLVLKCLKWLMDTPLHMYHKSYSIIDRINRSNRKKLSIFLDYRKKHFLTVIILNSFIKIILTILIIIIIL